MQLHSSMNFKGKDNDDFILEHAVGLRKSGCSVMMWTEDRNLRMKAKGDYLVRVTTVEMEEMIREKTISFLQRMMFFDKTLRNISEKMKAVPRFLREAMKEYPKQAISFLLQKTEKGQLWDDPIPEVEEPQDDGSHAEDVKLDDESSFYMEDSFLLQLFEEN